MAQDPFPPFSLTRAQEEEIEPLQKALGRYVDESIARFVLGELEVSDEQFSAFEEGLNALGLEKFLSIWQDVLDNTAEDIQ